MLAPDDLNYITEAEAALPREQLLKVIASLRRELEQEGRYRAENTRAMAAMSEDYRKTRKELDEARTELKKLKEAFSLLSDKEKIRTRDIFGRSTEKTADLCTSPPAQEETDEAEEEPPAPDAAAESPKGSPDPENPDGGNHGKKGGRKRKGKRAEDLSALPREKRYILNIEQLNSLYGEGNWRIAHWHCSERLEHSPEVAYVLETYTPVVSVGLEHELHTVPAEPALISGSLASASLAAYILFQKFFLAVPFYRLSLAFANLGLVLSRQDMNNWAIRLAGDIFCILTGHMKKLLLQQPYHQCDETTLRVIRDGRKAGSKSYIWLHMTSEMLDVHPIVLYCYEMTRGTDHLREFYEDFKGFISCDAYCSYHILEKEHMGVIIVCGCLAHMRRRFAISLSLIDTRNMSQEAVRELPEMKALNLLGKVYDADLALKHLPKEERDRRRADEVKPLLDQSYSYIESLDINDPSMGARLKDAICYAIGQKERLCRFLEDGNIPIDNSAAERHIKSLVIARKNFMSCTSIEGAEAVATIFSITETAKANKANVYWYLRYVLEEMPKYLVGKDWGFLDSMMPWSDEYRKYEEARARSPYTRPAPNEYSSPPKTPRKKKPDLGGEAAHLVA